CRHREKPRPASERRRDPRAERAQNAACRSTGCGESHALEQELRQDLLAPGADRSPDRDLTRARRDALPRQARESDDAEATGEERDDGEQRIEQPPRAPLLAEQGLGGHHLEMAAAVM